MSYLACLDCGRLSKTSRCPMHTRTTTNERGYDASHRIRAAALRALGRPCSLCGQPIDYTLPHTSPQSFNAHHVTQNRQGPLSPAHRVCNERAGKPLR